MAKLGQDLSPDPSPKRGGGRKRRRERDTAETPVRVADYRVLRNTLPRAAAFSADQVAELHETSLRVLEELGLRVLLPEARALFAHAGCKVDEDDQFVWIGREVVAEALRTAPPAFTFRPRGMGRVLPIDADSLIFGAGAGCPNITDLDRGRRPGRMSDFIETTKLHQSFDIIPLLAPSIEAQDVPVSVRHLDVAEAQLTLSDKTPWVYARGNGQVEDSFALIRIAQGLSREAFEAAPRCYTVINTNSPRQLDVPMSQGIIDFARANQPSVITPFCLAGAMAPITVAGALTLSHAEALAGIALCQLARPGAPVVYGAFSSNVDMKSGAPVFGTPEHIKANFGAGQLARHVGLPWRSAAGTAANSADVQGAYETQLALWGCLLAGANMILHSAGWLEGGLTFSMEKFITDLEVCQTVAECMIPVAAGADEIGFDAIAEVAPGGHFFAAAQTMARYQTEFYAPFVSDWQNFGQWSETGARSATERANAIWKRRIAEHVPPPMEPGRAEEMAAFIARRKAEGGSPPVD